jgi:PAS domain S-box-containing protein
MHATNGMMTVVIPGAAFLATGLVFMICVIVELRQDQAFADQRLDDVADDMAAQVGARLSLLSEIAQGHAPPKLLQATIIIPASVEQSLDPAAASSLRAAMASRRHWSGMSGGRVIVAVPQTMGAGIAAAATADLLWADGQPRADAPDAHLMRSGEPVPDSARVRTITAAAGQHWTLAIAHTPGWLARLPAPVWPWFVGVGALLSVAAALLSWRLSSQAYQLAHINRQRLDDINREISTRHRTEHELGRTREQLELLAAAVAKTTVGVVIAETADRGRSTVVFVNPAATRLIGTTSSQALGMSLDALLADGDAGPEATVLLAALAGGEHHRTDLRLGASYLAVSASPLRDEAGRTSHHLIMLSDVTDRRTAELALRESEDRFRHLADAAPVMIWMVSTDNTVAYRNHAYRTFTGLPEQGATTSVEDHVHPEDLEDWHATWGQAFSRRVPYAMEYRQRNAEGEWRWLAESGVPRQAPDGSFAGFIGICRDITDRRGLIDSLRAAKDAAEAADEAKSAFLAMMSHEIRTPLHGIMGMTALLLEEDLPAHQRELAATVRSCGDHLLGIVNDVLDFSRIAAGKLELDVEEFDLRSVIEDALATLGEAAHGKDLELAAHVDPALPDRLLGDAGRIRQILVNLVGNAVKFTDAGSVVVRVAWRGPDLAATVGTRRRAQSATLVAGAVELRIEDTGPGIAPEILPNLFQPFMQGDNSTTRQHGGTGLGLVICRRLAELMSGTVHAESEVGRGTAMVCSMRLVPVPGPSRRIEPRLAGVRIAILDHSPQELAMCVGLIEDMGAEAESCADLDEVVARVAAGASLIVADCSLAGRLTGCGRPVIALATLAERAARTAGDLPVLTRPLRRAALRAALVEAVG